MQATTAHFRCSIQARERLPDVTKEPAVSGGIYDMNRIRTVFAWSLLVFALANRPGLGWSEIPQGSDSTSTIAVGPQYDTTHVYVAPEHVEAFVKAFLGTFGGASAKQVVVTVTPTPSSTSSQLLQTPVGTVSLFGFKTPVPYPFGAERTGYLVTDLDTAISAAKSTGADVLVEPFPDPIGRDAVIQWPGGINTQLYWHFQTPLYQPFQAVPENRGY